METERLRHVVFLFLSITFSCLDCFLIYFIFDSFDFFQVNYLPKEMSSYSLSFCQ